MSLFDKAIKICDSPYIKNNDLKSIIDDLENLASRVKSVSDKSNDKDFPSLNRTVQDIKEIANNLRLYVK